MRTPNYITLEQLTNRIQMHEKFLKQHPEKRNMIAERYNMDTQTIVHCLLANKDNPKLKEIGFNLNA